MAEYYNQYETVVILRPYKRRSDDETTKETIDKIEQYFKCVTECKIGKDELGEKQLAYEIRRHKTGYYIIFRYYTIAETIPMLERYLRTQDRVLKFVTVKTDEMIDSEEFTTKWMVAPAELEDKTEQETAKKPVDVLDIIYGLDKKKGKKKEVK